MTSPVRTCDPGGAAPSSLERLVGRPLTPADRRVIRGLICQARRDKLAAEDAAHQAKVFAADPRKRP